MQELDSPAYPATKREKSLHPLRDLPVLDETARIGEIIRAYQRHKLMPQSPTGDALHLALASIHGCDLLLTWNVTDRRRRVRCALRGEVNLVERTW